MAKPTEASSEQKDLHARKNAAAVQSRHSRYVTLAVAARTRQWDDVGRKLFVTCIHSGQPLDKNCL